MKKTSSIFLILAICLAAGYGIGTLIANIMDKHEKTGWIGKSDIRIEDGVLSPEALLSLGRLSDPQLSPDGSMILYGVSYTSIKDNKSCRNLYICNPDGSNCKQLTRYASSVSSAKWSKDGKSIWFIQKGQLWKATFRNGKLGKKIQVSDVPAGISDYKIAPDEANILYISTIPGPVKSPKDSDPALDKAQAYVATDLMYRHWDHWVTETPRTYVAPLGKGTISPENSIDILGTDDPGYELPTEPFGGAEQLDWAPDSRRIAYSCRKHVGKEYAFSTNTSIYIYDIVSGETTEVTGRGGYDTDPAWSPDGTRLAWISMARDGYEADRQRLMIADMASGSPDSIIEWTKGYNYDVEGLTWLPDGSGIVFPSTIDGLTALCMADGNSITRLTPDNWWLGFGAPFAVESNDGKLSMLTTFQSMEFPTELVRVDVDSESNAIYEQLSHENDHILSQLDSIRQEQVWLDLPNGDKLHCWVLYPAGFDGNGNWPAIEMFNGGPQSCLEQSWSYRWNFRLMCQQGYVVILPNRHGNSGFGQPWKEEISGDYQGLNMVDYMTAGQWIKGREWCSKLAGVGASYGGFSVYNLMGIHGDLFDCFISHAGIFNERQMWYTTEESWFCNFDAGGLSEFAYEPGNVGPAGDGITFGGLQQAGSPYANVAKSQYHYANDPETRVTKWHTPILCMHGMMDFRIPYEQGMAAFNAAQMMGVPSKLVIFPEECHWVLQPQNALFWHREFFGWLDQWMK